MSAASYVNVFPLRFCGSDPYTVSYTKDRMIRVWDQLAAEGKHRWLFYDGGVRDAFDYVEFMCDPAVYAYMVCDHDWETPLAVYFLNNFMGGAAMMHFAFLDAGLGRGTAIGIDTTNFLLRNGGISALIGITPKPFRHAWRFALSVGFTQKAVIPKACRLAYAEPQRLVDAVVTLCLPETLLPFPPGMPKEITRGWRQEKNPESGTR